MKKELLHSCPELIDYINETGFLPLLSMDINGWSAEEVVDEDCQYTRLPDGGWEWPLWEWKGAILQESGCAYGKFFKDKAAFISREWWPDFCNYRRSVYPYPEAGSIEESILDVLKSEGSLITRELRAACGFTGPKMRSRFDAYITRLEMGGYIVTEDFIYPRDRTGKNTDGDGHCSQRRKHSSEERLVIPTAPHKNHANGCSVNSKRFYRMPPKRYTISYLNKEGKQLTI